MTSEVAELSQGRAQQVLWRSELRAEEWLLIEWPAQEQEPTKYWLSTLPAHTKLSDMVKLAKHRWIIEGDSEELKQALGLRIMKAALARVSSSRHFVHGRLWFLVAERSRFSPQPAPVQLDLCAPQIPSLFRPCGSPRGAERHMIFQ